MFDPGLVASAKILLALCRARGLRIATAESCTGGQIAALFTSLPGASEVFDRGFVTYSNEAKCDMLGIAPDVITAHGAVSMEVAVAMAEGALARSHAACAVAVTGVAGPGGGSEAKPVGLVHVAAAGKGHQTVHAEHRFGSKPRAAIQTLSVEAALRLLLVHVNACS